MNSMLSQAVIMQGKLQLLAHKVVHLPAVLQVRMSLGRLNLALEAITSYDRAKSPPRPMPDHVDKHQNLVDAVEHFQQVGLSPLLSSFEDKS